MSNTIPVDELRVGIFVQLEGGWLSHPFPLSSFRIATEEQVALLRGLGLPRIRWVPEKSDPPLTSSTFGLLPRTPQRAQPEEPVDEATAQARQRRLDLLSQRDATRRCEQQHAEAASAWRSASDAVRVHPQEAGRGSEELTQAILDKMLGAEEVSVRLVNGGSDRAAAHALNVTIISLLIARTMGFSEKEMLELGVGALMHDVGKLDVADRYRHAEDGFSVVEVNAYRDHVAKGVSLGQVMGLSAGALRVLAQHHEHADGSGFPLRLGGERITAASRVVALVNRYDNLCNPQARALALTPHEAVSLLFAQGRQRYDAAVLNAFIRMMGVYPAGSLVQLTDDRYAMVMGVNSSRPLKPRVLVHDPRVPPSEALMVDLETVTDLGIRRSLPANKLPLAAIEFLDPRPRVSYYFEPLMCPKTEEMAA